MHIIIEYISVNIWVRVITIAVDHGCDRRDVVLFVHVAGIVKWNSLSWAQQRFSLSNQLIRRPL